MTYQQIFEGRILLIGAMKHIVQQHAHYELMRSTFTFHSASGAEAFGIVHRRLQELESEFERKKSRRVL